MGAALGGRAEGLPGEPPPATGEGGKMRVSELPVDWAGSGEAAVSPWGIYG